MEMGTIDREGRPPLDLWSLDAEEELQRSLWIWINRSVEDRRRMETAELRRHGGAVEDSASAKYFPEVNSMD